MSLIGDVGREEEAEVIARCQEGDREAFRWIVENFGDILLGSAFLMTKDRQLAEDVVQETLLSAWKNIPSFKRDRPLKPWIMRILVNHIRMHMRQRRPELSGAASTRLDPDEIAGSYSETGQVETRDILHRALATLPKDQREPVVLRYFADLTIPDIARVTGLRQGTVKSRIHRGLERMREVVTEEEER